MNKTSESMETAKPDPACPRPNKSAAIMADFLGPLLSTNLPNMAADAPPRVIITVKAMVTDETDQPSELTNGFV
ncbi:hypothetical protein GCM10027443_32990 [Pontibacter brevis]